MFGEAKGVNTEHENILVVVLCTVCTLSQHLVEQVTQISYALCSLCHTLFFAVLFLACAFYCDRFDMNTFTTYYLFLDSICVTNSRGKHLFFAHSLHSVPFSLTLVTLYINIGFSLLRAKRNSVKANENTESHTSRNKSFLKGMLSAKHSNKN